MAFLRVAVLHRLRFAGFQGQNEVRIANRENPDQTASSGAAVSDLGLHNLAGN